MNTLGVPLDDIGRDLIHEGVTRPVGRENGDPAVVGAGPLLGDP
jgi:hypothetical protein